MKKPFLLSLVATGLIAPSASAAVIVLDFENIDPAYPSNNPVSVRNFYNGGTSNVGTSGTNYGVTFSDNARALCLNTPGFVCSSASRGGFGNPDSWFTGLFFDRGVIEPFLEVAIINVAAGFTTGFSFVYTAIYNPGSVNIYDGLNGTGNLLATLNLPKTGKGCEDYDPENPFITTACPFIPIGVSFNGTARSVSFVDAIDRIAFDDVTFGANIPGSPPAKVPEPSSILGLVVSIAFGAVSLLDRVFR